MFVETLLESTLSFTELFIAFPLYKPAVVQHRAVRGHVPVHDQVLTGSHYSREESAESVSEDE